LYGVAYRTALKARGRKARQRRDEARAARSPAVENPDGLVWRDLRPVLDESIAALPGKYREAFVLCQLEGLTVAQAGRRLGCPQGTVAGRLARAKERLRAQLARRGVTLPAAALAAVATQEAAAAVPAALACSTAQSALLAMTGQAAPFGLIASHGVTLIKGVLETMSTSKLATTAFLVVLAAGATGVGLAARQSGGEAAAAQPGKVKGKPAAEKAQLPETNPEERIYSALRDHGRWRSPAGDLSIWVHHVEGRRLLYVVLESSGGSGSAPCLTTCTEAELKVDPGRQVLHVYMKDGKSRGADGSRAYFVQREIQVSLAPPPRAAEASPPPARPAEAPGGDAPPLQAYVIEPPDVLLICAGEKLGLPAHALDGSHLVRPDGTVGLGAYGSVRVTGLTVDRAADAVAAQLKKAGVARHLSAGQVRRELKVDVQACNSKVCYVITDLGGG
jgi:hypothetical protein